MFNLGFFDVFILFSFFKVVLLNFSLILNAWSFFNFGRHFLLLSASMVLPCSDVQLAVNSAKFLNPITLAWLQVFIISKRLGSSGAFPGLIFDFDLGCLILGDVLFHVFAILFIVKMRLSFREGIFLDFVFLLQIGD